MHKNDKNFSILSEIDKKLHVVVFQPNWSNNSLKSGFFRISGKSGSRIRDFFGLKPSRDQDGANKKSLVKSVSHTEFFAIIS